ncbi:unnamed protein product [Tenebrio molitor]|nr:unnamed protein product [Tenebrio molitor]
MGVRCGSQVYLLRLPLQIQAQIKLHQTHGQHPQSTQKRNCLGTIKSMTCFIFVK